jgi:RNase P subunit RPR2
MPSRPEKIRHVDKGVLLASFAGKVIAICPNCGGPVLVTSQLRSAFPFMPAQARINCLHCSFQRASTDREWFGPVTGIARGRCPHCGFKWIRKEIQRKRLNNRASQYVSAACPSCEQVIKLPIKWTRERLGSPVDPVAGLPLWLQAPCCGHTLWAYNADHLTRLGAYVAAGLRERTANKHWSMFSRLPQWMTAGKNREAVLASINRLEKKLASVKF